MEKSTKKESNERNLQDYLSLGYIYLLILGIGREVIYYRFLDVNILSYSNVLDVLLSPIVYLSSKPIIVLLFIILTAVIYFINKANYKKKLKDDSISESGKVTAKNEILKGTLILLSLGIFGFFIGTGIGSGISYGSKLKKGEFEASHQITFLSDKELSVKLIGNNSQYIFYVLENEKQVTISPISGNVKMISKLPPKNE
ncbi:MAG: hypothetical protein AB8H03_11210 [Saprospiraceae bacterium]